MLIGIILFALVIAGVYYFKKKYPGVTVEEETQELLGKAEADGKKFVAYSEEELSKIEGDVATDAKAVETKVDTEVKTVEADVKKIV